MDKSKKFIKVNKIIDLQNKPVSKTKIESKLFEFDNFRKDFF